MISPLFYGGFRSHSHAVELRRPTACAAGLSIGESERLGSLNPGLPGMNPPLTTTLPLAFVGLSSSGFAPRAEGLPAPTMAGRKKAYATPLLVRFRGVLRVVPA